MYYDADIYKIWDLDCGSFNNVFFDFSNFRIT